MVLIIPQLCRRYQTDQKIPLCLDSCQNCMKSYMDEPMMQRCFFGHREALNKVLAKYLNIRKPISGFRENYLKVKRIADLAGKKAMEQYFRKKYKF